MTHSARSEPIEKRRSCAIATRSLSRAPGANLPGDIAVGRVDHAGRYLEEFYLLRRFDLVGVKHRLLTADDLDAFGFERAQH